MAYKKNYQRAPLFNPRSRKPFRVSRTKLELFMRCPKCFYLSQRLGLKMSDDRYFGLNLRIDGLLKKDADRLRVRQMPDPRAKKIGVNATPFNHPSIKQWLDVFNSTGLVYLHPGTNLIVFGAPDDIWLIDKTDRTELSIVDAKATHSNQPLEKSYFWEENKRQVELYSWLLAKQELPLRVSDTSYFIRVNTKKSQDSFECNCLEFETEVVPYKGDNSWVEPKLLELKACLTQKKPPEENKKCGHCKYRAKAAKIGI